MPNTKETKKYISLSKAAEAYGCTQKHLNLMVRQRRLKAVKIGRNWVTTKGWLREYKKGIKVNGVKKQKPVVPK